jgi:protein-serine/threonine kinase
MEANPNNQRLYLNFGNNNERLAPVDRAYPTTPSTFPQPVYPQSSSGQSSGSGLQTPQQQQPYPAGFAQSSNGYFAQNQYASSYSNPPMNDYSSQASAFQQRSNTPGTNDPNTGLAQQFSQLGGAARPSPYGSRGPSPAQRPRTAGATGQQASTGYGNYMVPPLPSQAPAAPVTEFQPAPERNPDRYGPNANHNQKKCSQLASDFFKDSVKRARERNQRQVPSFTYPPLGIPQDPDLIACTLIAVCFA